MHRTTQVLLVLILLGLGGVPIEAKSQKAAEKEREARVEAMRKAVHLWVNEKGGEFIGDVIGIVDSKGKTFILKCGVMNRTKKDIRGVRGYLRLTTLFGEPIGDIHLQTTALIPAGKRVAIEWKAGGDRFGEEGRKRFEKLKLEEMKQVWVPTMVVFTDGTALK